MNLRNMTRYKKVNHIFNFRTVQNITKSTVVTFHAEHSIPTEGECSRAWDQQQQMTDRRMLQAATEE